MEVTTVYALHPYYWREDVRDMVAPDLRDLPDHALARYVDAALGGASVEEVEDFLGTLKQVGAGIVQALPAVLPIVGTAIGGPIGGVVGGAAGAALGAATTAAKPGPPPSGTTKPAPKPPPQPGQHPPPPPPGVSPPSAPPAVPPVAGRGAPPPSAQPPGSAPGSVAAAQLLSLLFRPELLDALIAMVMGPAGRRNVPVDDVPVPPGAFTNLLGVLAGEAAAEYNAAIDNAAEPVPRYLLDAEGAPRCEVTDSHARAAVLWETLNQPAEQPDWTLYQSAYV